MKPNPLASAIVLIAPVIILFVSFAIIGCSWEYYIIGWFAGLAIGILALLTIIKLTK